MSLSSILVGASSFLLLSLGITEIALTGHGQGITSDFANRGTSDLRDGLGGIRDLKLLPADYEKGPTWTVLAAGVVAAVTGLVGLLALGLCKEATANVFYATIGTGILGILSVFITVAALIYGMVAQSQSSTWHYSGLESSDGKYTVEGWACQMKDVMIGRQDEFSTVCKESMAARYITIPLLLCGIVFMMVAFSREKARRRANAQRSLIKQEEELNSF